MIITRVMPFVVDGGPQFRENVRVIIVVIIIMPSN